MRPKCSLFLALAIWVLGIPGGLAAPLDPAFTPLLKRAFFHGRDYFVLRSGRAEMIVQADQADLGPAWMYLLFDAQDSRQSARKERALNFGDGQGFANSALEVVLGGFAFTALGHETQTRWTTCEGIPAAEAVWWAGGLRVREQMVAVAGKGAFVRRIQVESVNLGGSEEVKLRLALPPGNCAVRRGMLVQETAGALLSLGVTGACPAHAIPESGVVEIGPLAVRPGQSISVDTVLAVRIPAGEPGLGWWPAGTPESVGAPTRPASEPAPVWAERVGSSLTQMNWAKPSKPCDASMRNIMLALGQPLRFLIHAPKKAKMGLVLGFCEGYHAKAGQRLMEVQIEGRRPQGIDLAAEHGLNVPVGLVFEAQDANADGVIELAVAPVPQAPDKNTILNALWVFEGPVPPAAEILEGKHNKSARAFIHADAPETSPPGVPMPSLALGDALAETRAWWEKASSVTTPDATVKDIFDKARIGLPAMIADTGVMNAGIFEYGAQWVRDTSNTLLGLLHAGHFELARAGFANILNNMVREDGTTMIGGGFDDPDREQFDQMGELMHALKAYRDWTGDDSLIRQHRARLVAMVERPLRPEFRDGTAMVHNRREFWERTFEDAYELAYQTYLVAGLRDAAELAGPLGVPDRAARWRGEAERTLQAMLQHPTRALVESGRLIKRRGVQGEPVREIRFPAAAPDVPLKTETVHLAEPDATMALPIALGLVDPRSALARRTMDELERLWNARWFGGGYERYHSSGQCDQPGPWSFATCFILRAQHDAGLLERSRRTLEWLNQSVGGRTGAWLEEVPLVRSQEPTTGILPWTSGEVGLFVVHHLLGVRFEGSRLVLKPALYPGSPPVSADLRFRQGRLRLTIPRSGPVKSAGVDGQTIPPDADGAVRLPGDFAGGTVTLRAGE